MRDRSKIKYFIMDIALNYVRNIIGSFKDWNIMLFLKLDSYIIHFLVFLLVTLANMLGLYARIKPLKNPILHSLHHIFYFFVILFTSISILHSYLLNLPFVYEFLILGLMFFLPFVRRGRSIHVLIGLSSFICAIIPVINKYFN